MATERIQRGALTLLLFPPSMLSLYAQSAGGDTAVPHSASEALQNSGGEAVLDGPMFTKCDPSGSYASQDCGHVVYQHFDLSSGVSFESKRSSVGMTISVMPDGSTVAASGSTAAQGARLSVQLYPKLVVQGQPASVADQGVFGYVAALAVMRDGRMAFVIGRNMSLPTFARQLADAGAVYAGYTDGGGSASLATLDGYVGSSEHRRVLTWLVAKPSTGSSMLAMLAVAALAIGVGWWWYKNATHFRGLPLPRHNPRLPHSITRDDLVRHLATIAKPWRRTFDEFKMAAHDLLSSGRETPFFGRPFGEWVDMSTGEPDGGPRLAKLIRDAWLRSVETYGRL